MSTQLRNNQTGGESSIGELLQSAITVASIALGLLGFFRDVHPVPVVPLLVFAAGIAALYASVLALKELLEEQRRPWSELLGIRTSIGIIFWSIVFLAFAYVLIVRPDIGNMIADLFESVAKVFRPKSP